MHFNAQADLQRIDKKQLICYYLTNWLNNSLFVYLEIDRSYALQLAVAGLLTVPPQATA
jgi:hypothetical protein